MQITLLNLKIVFFQTSFFFLNRNSRFQFDSQMLFIHTIVVTINILYNKYITYNSLLCRYTIERSTNYWPSDRETNFEFLFGGIIVDIESFIHCTYVKLCKTNKRPTQITSVWIFYLQFHYSQYTDYYLLPTIAVENRSHDVLIPSTLKQISQYQLASRDPNEMK